MALAADGSTVFVTGVTSDARACLAASLLFDDGWCRTAAFFAGGDAVALQSPQRACAQSPSNCVLVADIGCVLLLTLQRQFCDAYKLAPDAPVRDVAFVGVCDGGGDGRVFATGVAACGTPVLATWARAKTSTLCAALPRGTQPRGMCMWGDAALAIADQRVELPCVLVVGVDGAPLQCVGETVLHCPEDVACTQDGRILVADRDGVHAFRMCDAAYLGVVHTQDCVCVVIRGATAFALPRAARQYVTFSTAP
jgi:hypothetical protein